MAGFFDCGFARVAVKESFSDCNGKPVMVKEKRLDSFHARFEGEFKENFHVIQKIFNSKSQTLVKNFNNWKDRVKKQCYMKHFSAQSWSKVPASQKAAHTLSNCKACRLYHCPIQSLFPVRSLRLKNNNPFKQATDVEAQLKSHKPLNPTQSAIKDTARQIYNKVNEPFKGLFSVDLKDALTKVPELRLQTKKSHSEMKKSRRAKATGYKKAIEQQWSSVDVDTFLGSRQSYSQRNLQRKALFFESPGEARARTEKRKLEEETGVHKPKKHSPDHTECTFDKVGLLEEVNNMKDGEMINLSYLARRHGIEEKSTGNVIVKKFLEDSGVDLSRFKHLRKKQKPNVRRRINKMFGGEISVPVPRTNDLLRQEIMKKVESGEYNMGKIVVPRQYKKIALTPEGNLKEEEFTVSGRHITLRDIRERLLKQHEQMGLVRDHSEEHYANMTPEEVIKRLTDLGEYTDNEDITCSQLKTRLMTFERTRHFMIWSDHSSIMNHGHILLTVNTIYDPAFYFTKDELKQQKGEVIEIERIVETPQTYILGRCSDALIDQLCYVDTRVDDLTELEDMITSSQGVNICDILRFFHGDHPAQEFEAGQQDGGDYPCTDCSTRTVSWTSQVTCYRSQIVTLQDRVNKVMEGPAGRKGRNGGVHPFKGMTIDELQRECESRGLATDNLRKPELQKQLKHNLHGIQRVPALLLNNKKKSLQDLHLQNYEILSTEPLHDIKEHIKNIVKEIPYKLLPGELAAFNKVKEAILAGKDKLRGSDYRLFAVVLALHISTARLTVKTVLYTLAEISELCYALPELRTPKFVLRFFNTAFVHSIAFQRLFPDSKELTIRKLYGAYWHSITIHAPVISRLISLSSVNTEQEERQFADINSISKTTSNGRPSHIIPNSIIRLQAEHNFKHSREDTFTTQQSNISKFARQLPPNQNTTFFGDILASEEYQAHLERISDYLVFGEGVWWHIDHESNAVVFHDGAEEPENREEGPILQHFRSSSLESIQTLINKKWDECLEKKVKLPITRLKKFLPNGNFSCTEENNLFDNQEHAQTLLSQTFRNEEPPTIPDEPVDNDKDESETVVTSFTQVNPSEYDASMHESDNEQDISITPPTTKTLTPLQEQTSTEKHQKYVPTPISDKASCSKTMQLPETPLTRNHRKRNNSTIKSAASELYSAQTTLGQNLMKVLGGTVEVQNLDKCRLRMKASSSIANREEYKTALAFVQSKVLAKHEKLTKQIKTWEREFLMRNGREPWGKDLKKNSAIHGSFKAQELAKQFLKHWGITVHL